MNQLQSPVRRNAFAHTKPAPDVVPQTVAPPPKRLHSFAALSLLPPASAVQRDDDPSAADAAAPDAAAPDAAAPDAAAPVSLPTTTFTMTLPPAAPVNASDLPQGPGDFGPLPGTAPPETAMAKHDETIHFDTAVVQRDDDPPALGTDVQVTYPFQLQVSTVYRGFDLAHLHDFLGTLDIGHEPSASVSFSADPGAGPVGQIAIGLANQHINLLGSDVQAQLVASVSGGLGSGASTPPQAGLGSQLEIPIKGPYSIVFNYGGTYTTPGANQPGKISWSGSGGILAHF